MFFGVWRLVSWSAVWAYQFEGTVNEFLYQDPTAPLPEVNDAGDVRGSTLTIDAAGAFFQAGQCDAPILTYDGEGIQVSGVPEFGGRIHEEGERGYLLCQGIPRWATPKDEAAQTRLRWDNGDIKVCDSIRLVGNRLLRTICVVTDECYGDRIVLVYEQ